MAKFSLSAAEGDVGWHCQQGITQLLEWIWCSQYPEKDIQKGDNICSHRQIPHLLLQQKHWEEFAGPLPEGILPICTRVTLSIVQHTPSVTYSHRSASYWFRPSTNGNYNLYLIRNTPHQIRSHHIRSMFCTG